MLDVLHVLTVLLVAVAFALALAHVAELPGKKRLPRDTYLRVQRIYYPGFTVGGGIGEFGGLLAAIVLAIVTPRGTTAFWLTLVAVLGLVGMQVVFWTVTQPVNRFWLHGENLGNFSSGFFGVHRVDQGTHGAKHGRLDQIARPLGVLARSPRRICDHKSYRASHGLQNAMTYGVLRTSFLSWSLPAAGESRRATAFTRAARSLTKLGSKQTSRPERRVSQGNVLT